jgi:hypothetical protein
MNLERLRELLDAAVKLELATIPPYLCALYSIHPGTNLEATMVVRSVVVEEMLHMILAGNVLNAIGGRPRVSGPENAPHYPHVLPDGVILDLLPFSPAAVESFLRVENPEYKAEQQPDTARRRGWGSLRSRVFIAQCRVPLGVLGRSLVTERWAGHLSHSVPSAWLPVAARRSPAAD